MQFVRGGVTTPFGLRKAPPVHASIRKRTHGSSQQSTNPTQGPDPLNINGCSMHESKMTLPYVPVDLIS